MSIHESLEGSLDKSPQHPWRTSRSRPRQAIWQSSKLAESFRTPSERSRRSPDSSEFYHIANRDVLYRAVHEFQLPESDFNSYSTLLVCLGFDLIPLVSQGQIWHLCMGRQNDDSPCRRMVPELYLRTAIGKILRAANRLDLTGDDLVDALATALSYAICSEHHRTIHKVARAIEARKVVEQWRAGYSTLPEHMTPVRGRSPRSQQLASSPNGHLFDNVPRTPSPVPNLDGGADLELVGLDEISSPDSFAEYGVSERLKVERAYQKYLRASSQVRRREPELG